MCGVRLAEQTFLFNERLTIKNVDEDKNLLDYFLFWIFNYSYFCDDKNLISRKDTGMLGLGTPELLLVLVVALIVLGPTKLPEIARAIGKAIAEFRRAIEGINEPEQNNLVSNQFEEEKKGKESKKP
jgi:TatA/E family protein of Tat protein translocase